MDNPFDDPTFFSSPYAVADEDMQQPPKKVERTLDEQDDYDLRAMLAAQQLHTINLRTASISTKRNVKFLIKYYEDHDTFEDELLQYAEDVYAMHKKKGRKAKQTSRAGAIETKKVIAENIRFAKQRKKG